jgi:hypothetical protein
MADDITLSFGGGEQAPPGDYPAVCVDLQDLGVEYQRDGRSRHTLRLWFELAGHRQRDGRPFFISRKFGATLSGHPHAKLLPFLVAWRSAPFTPAELQNFRLVNVVNQSCILRLVQSQPDARGMCWTNIDGIMPAREQVRPSGLYSRPPPQSRQPVYPQQCPQPVYQQPMQPAYQPAPGCTIPQAYPQQPPTSCVVPAPAQPPNSQTVPAPGPVAPSNPQTTQAPAPATQPAPSPITGPTAHTPDNSKLPF